MVEPYCDPDEDPPSAYSLAWAETDDPDTLPREPEQPREWEPEGWEWEMLEESEVEA